MKDEHLHLLIDEEIYIVDSRQSIVDGRQSLDSSSPEAKSKENFSIEEIANPQIEKIKIAFIHNSSKREELELLDKIINACKLGASEFKIVSGDQKISFEKAVIFSNEADKFYTPLKKEQGEIMHSKPLQIMAQSKEEKGKLWSVLQKFVS